MVQGFAQLHARFGRALDLANAAARDELEKQATIIVADMNRLKPLPNIQIAWTWGDVPAGSLKIGTVRSGANKGNTYEFMSVTIYATAVDGGRPFPAIAAWFEFGTGQRFHKSGKSTGSITAQPYFFPGYRINRTRARTAITRAIRTAIRKA